MVPGTASATGIVAQLCWAGALFRRLRRADHRAPHGPGRARRAEHPADTLWAVHTNGSARRSGAWTACFRAAADQLSVQLSVGAVFVPEYVAWKPKLVVPPAAIAPS